MTGLAQYLYRYVTPCSVLVTYEYLYLLTGVSNEEVEATVDLLTVLSQKLNVTDSFEAEQIVDSLLNTIDLLLHDRTPWVSKIVTASSHSSLTL